MQVLLCCIAVSLRADCSEGFPRKLSSTIPRLPAEQCCKVSVASVKRHSCSRPQLTSLRLRGGRGVSGEGSIKHAPDSLPLEYNASLAVSKQKRNREGGALNPQRKKSRSTHHTQLEPADPMRESVNSELPEATDAANTARNGFSEQGMCTTCGVQGHRASECPAGVAEDLKMRKMKACYVCGQGGHWFHECTERNDSAKASPRKQEPKQDWPGGQLDDDIWEEGWEVVSVDSEGDLLESEDEEQATMSSEQEVELVEQPKGETHSEQNPKGTQENHRKNRNLVNGEADSVRETVPDGKGLVRGRVGARKHGSGTAQRSVQKQQSPGAEKHTQAGRAETVGGEQDKEEQEEGEEAKAEQQEAAAMVGRVMGAAERGNLTVLAPLVKARREVLAWRNKNGQTPLLVAAENGRLDAVQFMVKQGAGVSDTDALGRTALHAAASRGRHWMLKPLAALGLAVDAEDRAGRTALMLAAWRNSARCLEPLLALNCSAEVRDRHQCSALHFASWRGNEPCVHTLLLAGAQVDPVDDGGGTPLHKACLQGHAAVTRILLENNASATATDHNRCSALHLAASKGHLEIIDLLLRHGADVDAADRGGKTPLHWAAHNGHSDAAGRLAEGGAEVNRADRLGATPLHVAAQHANPLTSELLLMGAGADATATDRLKNTPAHIAARHDHREVMEVLAGAGVDLAALDVGGWSALHWATHCNASKTAAFLRAQGCSTEGEPARPEEVMDVDELRELATPALMGARHSMAQQGVWTGTCDGQPAFVKADNWGGGQGAEGGWAPGQHADGCAAPGVEEGWEPAPEIAVPPGMLPGEEMVPGLSSHAAGWGHGLGGNETLGGQGDGGPRPVGQGGEEAENGGGVPEFLQQFGSDLPSRRVTWA